MNELKQNQEVAYLLNGDMLLHQTETQDGVSYALFDCLTRQKTESGLIRWNDMLENPIHPMMACARDCITKEIGLELRSVHKVSVMMLEPFRESGIHARSLWKPDTLPQNDIRFINSNYETLFYLPNGSYIQIDFPKESRIQQCVFLDPYHTNIGQNTFHICEFAERMEQLGATFQPEPELLTRQGAWQIGKDHVLSMEATETGVSYTLFDRHLQIVTSGQMNTTSHSMQEAREAILDGYNLNYRVLKPVPFEQIPTQMVQPTQEELRPASPARYKKQDMER